MVVSFHNLIFYGFFLSFNLIFFYFERKIFTKFYIIIRKNVSKFEISLFGFLFFIILFFLIIQVTKLQLDFLTQYIITFFLCFFIFLKAKTYKIIFFILFCYILYFIINFDIDVTQSHLRESYFNKLVLFILRYGLGLVIVFFLFLKVYFHNNNKLQILFKYLIFLFILSNFFIAFNYIQSEIFFSKKNIYVFLTSDFFVFSILPDFIINFLSKIHNRFDWIFSFMWKFNLTSMNFQDINDFKYHNFFTKLFSGIIYLLNAFDIVRIQNIEIGTDFKIFFNEGGSFNIDFISFIILTNHNIFYFIINYLIVLSSIYFNFKIIFVNFESKLIKLLIFTNFISTIVYSISSLYQDRYIEIIFYISILNASLLILSYVIKKNYISRFFK